MTAEIFHPLIAEWFGRRFGQPTAPQSRGWPAIARGEHTLIAAPTGSGKTLAAFLWSIDRLFRLGAEGRLEDRTYVVYVSPLKALGNDIHKNLQEPLTAVEQMAERKGLSLPPIRTAVRTGDTPQYERQKMRQQPPHILITTPESLYIMLSAEGSRGFLAQAETMIVDEIHAVAGDKRGSHLCLSLERLEALAGGGMQRIGLSATQKPIQLVAGLLVGADNLGQDGTPECTIVDLGHLRHMDLAIEVPDHELGPMATHEMWDEIYDRLAEHARQHTSTLVFVNTRRLVERVAFQLSQRLGEAKVAAHHGSLSRATRLEAEAGLKSGGIPVVVATASLELGIDIGHVDLVCHIGAPRALASLLQRVGRSAHLPAMKVAGELTMPKGVLFPLTRDELVQSAAAVRAVRAGELECIEIADAPLDVLAQQMVAIVASGEIQVEDLFDMVRRAFPYRHLRKEDFEAVLSMISEGVASPRGRRSAYIHHDRVHGRLRPRRAARLTAITSGGAIPDTADYDVVEEPAGKFVGRVNEDFAIESMAGDIFLLGNKSWRIRRVMKGEVHVEDAHGAPPSIPFWLGEAPARSRELSRAVSDLRLEVRRRLSDVRQAIRWLVDSCALDQAGAEQLVAYVSETVAALGEVPSQETVVAERFFDESGGMQLVVHAPFGGRINRAWCLALRKKFCLTFDFELQAAATDDGFVLSLGEQHSFPLESVFKMLPAKALLPDLVQATLAAPMFTSRWRWNASRSLALPRFNGGRRVPMPIQRMRAEDLLAAVFPAQVMCQDNRSGPVEVPDHPLVNETVANCLQEAMDARGLSEMLSAIQAGTVKTLAADTTAPSAMSHEILNANPYAFLDDAPLEERRARAVALRRINPDLARGIGALDPEAMDAVCAQAWPDVRDADELHDVLLSLCLLPEDDAADWLPQANALVEANRATLARWQTAEGETRRGYVAAERLGFARAIVSPVDFDPALSEPPLTEKEKSVLDQGGALAAVVQGWIEVLGPTTAGELASRLGLDPGAVLVALTLLESQGNVLRGQFRSEANPSETEWCDRRLLARIHRRTISILRRQVESVSAADFIRFLLHWQHVYPGAQLQGREGLLLLIGQLQGLELPAPAWEADVLPARVKGYVPEDLEALSLAGWIMWGRLRAAEVPASDEAEAPSSHSGGTALTRAASLGFFLRQDFPLLTQGPANWRDVAHVLSTPARQVAEFLEAHGAAFSAELERATGLLPARAEGALWELVALGLVSGDGLAGLRRLLTPSKKRRHFRRLRRQGRSGRAASLMPDGRWSLLSPGAARAKIPDEERNAFWARQLLRRYGVVFRELLTREHCAPAWRNLLYGYRRMEARGEIRGGRFVSGLVGEQFALPEAVDSLRRLRREDGQGKSVVLSAADPLNLLGILTPGDKISPLSRQVIKLQEGVPVDAGPLGAVRHRGYDRALAERKRG